MVYKYGFNLSLVGEDIYLTDVLDSPEQLTTVDDQDYLFPINAIYADDIASIQNILIDKLTSPCKAAIGSSIQLYSDPGLVMTASSISTFTLSLADNTNVDSYFFEHIRLGVVLGTNTSGASIVAATVFPTAASGDAIRGGVILTNGVKVYATYTATSIVGAINPWVGVMSGSRVDDEDAYTMNTDRDAILLTDSTWGAIDGIWAVKVTITYTTPGAVSAITSYIKCIKRDIDTDMGCRVFNALSNDPSKDLPLLAMHQTIDLAIGCDRVCEASTFWETLYLMTTLNYCEC